MVIFFVSVTWELSVRGCFVPFYFCYVDPLVAGVYLKPFIALPDVSDLERVLFEPFLSNFLPPHTPRPPPHSSQELIPVRLEITKHVV